MKLHHIARNYIDSLKNRNNKRPPEHEIEAPNAKRSAPPRPDGDASHPARTGRFSRLVHKTRQHLSRQRPPADLSTVASRTDSHHGLIGSRSATPRFATPEPPRSVTPSSALMRPFTPSLRRAGSSLSMRSNTKGLDFVCRGGPGPEAARGRSITSIDTSAFETRPVITPSVEIRRTESQLSMRSTTSVLSSEGRNFDPEAVRGRSTTSIEHSALQRHLEPPAATKERDPDRIKHRQWYKVPRDNAYVVHDLMKFGVELTVYRPYVNRADPTKEFLTYKGRMLERMGANLVPCSDKAQRQLMEDVAANLLPKLSEVKRAYYILQKAFPEAWKNIGKPGNFRGAGRMTFFNKEDVGTCRFLPCDEFVDDDLSGDDNDATLTQGAASVEAATNHAIQHRLAPLASTLDILRNDDGGSVLPQSFPAFSNRPNTGRKLNRLWHPSHGGTSVFQVRRGSTTTLQNDGAPEQLDTVRELLELSNISSH